jgi:hypothetical protein
MNEQQINFIRAAVSVAQNMTPVSVVELKCAVSELSPDDLRELTEGRECMWKHCVETGYEDGYITSCHRYPSEKTEYCGHCGGKVVVV